MGDFLGKAFGTLDSGRAARRLISDLTSQPDFTKLREILAGTRPGRERLANTVWGTIRWSRQLGCPGTPTLAAGFVIMHIVDRTEHMLKGNAEIPFVVREPQPPPILWDGTGTGAEHAVHFFSHAAGARPANARSPRDENANEFTPELAPGIAWAGRSPFAPPGVLGFHPPRTKVVLEGDAKEIDILLRPGFG